jgi:hypothetical protein
VNKSHTETRAEILLYKEPYFIASTLSADIPARHRLRSGAIIQVGNCTLSARIYTLLVSQ